MTSFNTSNGYSGMSAKAQFRVIVGFDSSDLGRGALTEALRICGTQRGAALHVITVGLPASFGADGLVGKVPSLVDQDAAAAVRAQVLEIARDYVAKGGVVEWERIEVHALVGSATECIVAFAKAISADLIVLGTHGRHGLARLLHGSVADAVVQAAPCGVLVVRARDVLGGERRPELQPAMDSKESVFLPIPEGVTFQYLDRMSPGSTRRRSV